MAGLNIHQTEEITPQVSSLEDQLRLREEIERQLEVERETARAMTQNKIMQDEILRQAAARKLQQEEERELRQLKTNATQNSQVVHKRRAYGVDALLLCAVTLGMGALLGPIVRPAPVLSPAYTHYTGGFLPAGGLAGRPVTWDRSSIDMGGNDWSGSQMTVDREIRLSDGREYIEGHADWNVSGDYVGSEKFSGSYDPSNGQYDVVGNVIEQPNMGTPVHLVPGHYTGTMTSGGQLLNGYMEGAPGVSAIPGHFSGAMNP